MPFFQTFTRSGSACSEEISTRFRKCPWWSINSSYLWNPTISHSIKKILIFEHHYNNILCNIFILFYYACSITISNSTCFVGLHIYFFSKLTYLLYTQVSDSSTCYFILYNFSRVMLNTYLLKILAYLLIRLSLLSNIILPSTYASIIFSSHPVFLTNFVPWFIFTLFFKLLNYIMSNDTLIVYV